MIKLSKFQFIFGIRDSKLVDRVHEYKIKQQKKQRWILVFISTWDHSGKKLPCSPRRTTLIPKSPIVSQASNGVISNEQVNMKKFNFFIHFVF